MDIAGIIKNLLFHHNCVIVPGFGGLVAEYAPARIHPTQHIFLPPHKTIAFNRNLHNNDGLLIAEIARAGNANYGEAALELQHFVRFIESSLKNKGSFVLPDIGRFYYDIEKNLQFKTEENQNFLLNSFGLDHFIAHPVMRREEVISAIATSRIQTNKKSRFKWVSLGMMLVLAIGLVMQVIFVSNDQKGINLQQTGLYKMVSGLLTPSKTTVSPAPVKIAEHRKDTLVQIVVIQNATANHIDTAAIVANSLHTDSVKAPVKIEASPAPVASPATLAVTTATTTSPFTTGNYYIIFGCFKGHTASQTLIDQLSKKGIPASIVINDSYLRIGVGGYNTAEEATEAIKPYHEKGIKDAWVMKK